MSIIQHYVHVRIVDFLMSMEYQISGFMMQKRVSVIVNGLRLNGGVIHALNTS